MSLLSKLARYFDSQVRYQGQSYYQERRVVIRNGSSHNVEAEVYGTKAYWVSIELSQGLLTAECSCPYAENDFCKHIFATMLMAERRGFLSDLKYEYSLKIHLGSTGEGTSATNRASSPGENTAPENQPPVWDPYLQFVRQEKFWAPPKPETHWPRERELVYYLSPPAELLHKSLTLEVLIREKREDGTESSPKRVPLKMGSIADVPDRTDQRILSILYGTNTNSYHLNLTESQLVPTLELHSSLWGIILPDMVSTGRAFFEISKDEIFLIQDFEAGDPWEFRLSLAASEDRQSYHFSGYLRRGEEQKSLQEPHLLFHCGLLVANQSLARLQHHGGFDWIRLFRKAPPLSISQSQIGSFLKELLSLPHLPPLDVPPELEVKLIQGVPTPRLLVRRPPASPFTRSDQRLAARLSFSYEGVVVAGGGPEVLFQSEKMLRIQRNREKEEQASEILISLGFHQTFAPSLESTEWEISSKKFASAVIRLGTDAWHIEAEGKLYRSLTQFKMGVSSGTDWFDLNGEWQFGEVSTRWPALLESIKKKESFVLLDDGTFGILPEEWLKKYGIFVHLGRAEGDALRFTKGQAGLLDALMSTLPEVSCDELFNQARAQILNFDGIHPLEPAGQFKGELRPYQKDGLGWFAFLRRFGFGGCLADDMGLGKTVQVLALLESRRRDRKKSKGKHPPQEAGLPSLAVVPKTLVFNWIEEARRFTPKLRVLDHTGTGRQISADHFSEYDLVLTTYGTLRRDAIEFKDIQFDYLILDEAQAIKNATTDSAKAVRLLKGNHRLALSGTPIENHLGELWSLFEYLNPGLLGSNQAFKMIAVDWRNPSEESRALLSQMLKPFILRRTKNAVARDLPDKFEQTLFCEMDADQAQFYAGIRDYYRHSLLKQVDQNGIKKSKIQILEALLRLRQAACHPSLIDKKKKHSSAKVELLMEQLREILDENHKVLVFSQFTSFLDLIKTELNSERTPFLYLDGATRDRGSLVEKFQTDPESRLFLISLKAGGLGLNLTAAEYVILLDPWWNPAVEAQAIDRTHRIGQTAQVFAYRLITRGTVEEKVVEMQNSKRALADSIVQADSSLIRSLQREDLERLFS